MKIPLLYIPGTKFKKFLHIEPGYTADKPLVPIGCDCHPAWMLRKLHIRESGYPFDWLDTQAHLGLDYVNQNIKTNFKHYLEGITRNADGNLIAERYPHAVLLHETELAPNSAARIKLERRVERFRKQFEKGNNRYLYNLPVDKIKDEAQADVFLSSVDGFTAFMKDEDILHIILRYDESADEHPLITEKLLNRLKDIPKVHSAQYTRQLKQFGLWGNPAEYPALFNELNIPIKRTFTKIYVK